MKAQSFLRAGLITACAIGIALSAASSSFAASSRGGTGGQGGGSSSSGGGSAGNGGGKGGSPDPSARLVIVNDDNGCHTRRGCGGDEPRRIKVRAQPRQLQHCDSYEWRTVILPDGTIAEDRSQPMRKLCLVVPNDY